MEKKQKHQLGSGVQRPQVENVIEYPHAYLCQVNRRKKFEPRVMESRFDLAPQETSWEEHLQENYAHPETDSFTVFSFSWKSNHPVLCHLPYDILLPLAVCNYYL